MTHLEASIEISTSMVEVFSYVAVPARMPLWMSSVVSATCASVDAVRVGTIFHQRWQLLGRLLETTCEVLEYEPPRAFAYQGVTGAVCCFVHSGCAPLAHGTRLSWHSALDLRAVFHQQLPLAVSVAQRLLEVDLLTVRAVLERRENRTNGV